MAPVTFSNTPSLGGALCPSPELDPWRPWWQIVHWPLSHMPPIKALNRVVFLAPWDSWASEDWSAQALESGRRNTSLRTRSRYPICPGNPQRRRVCLFFPSPPSVTLGKKKTVHSTSVLWLLYMDEGEMGRGALEAPHKPPTSAMLRGLGSSASLCLPPLQA